MSLNGRVAKKSASVDAPAVGNMPLLRVILDQTAWAESVWKAFPSVLKKSSISLTGRVPSSISVLSYVRFIPTLWISEIGYPSWIPKPWESEV